MTRISPVSERAAFIAAYPHLDLVEMPDAWGRPMFKHTHVQALWEGWFARACLHDHAQCQQEWQPMATFPEDGEDYLATDNRVLGGFPQVIYWDNGRLRVPDAQISYSKGFFTHWMKLPTPPDTSTDRPAYADTDFKYNEATGSYHRITAPQTSTIRPGPMEGAGSNPASDRKDQSLVEEGGSIPPLAATHTRPLQGGK